MYRLLLHIAFASLALSAGQAQQPVFPVWHYSTDDGLPSPEVYFTHQDRQGYMWFATDRGLSRFDGYEFRNYGMKDGLLDLVVFQIQEDVKGKLWLKTLSNQIFILENDSIRPYPYNHLLNSRKNADFQFFSIFVDPNEALYFSFPMNGFYRFDPENNTMHPAHQCEAALVIMDQHGWKDLSYCVGEKGGFGIPPRQRFDRLAIRGDSFQVCIQSPESQVVITTALPPGFPYPFSPNRPRFIWTKPGPSQYLFQLYHTFFFVENEKVLWTRFDTTEMDCLFTSSDGAIWMGGRSGGGLRRYASADAVRKGNFSLHLDQLSISHISEGRKGVIWASTLDNGVFCIPPSQVESFGARSGLPGLYILDLVAIDTSEVYFTTQNGFLCRLDLRAGAVEATRLPRSANYSVHWDKVEKRLWLSSDEISYRHEGQWKNVPGPYLASKKFFPLRSPPGALAVSSPYALITVSTRTKQALTTNFGGDLDFQSRTLCIHQDFSGRIWVGTLEGLKRLDGRKLAEPPFEHPGFKVRVNALAELTDSTLVIGTQGQGLFFWKGDRLTHLGESEGLVSDIVECLHVDGKGQLWVGARNGLNKIESGGSRKMKIRTFTMQQGLPSSQINAIASAGDHIWLGTAKGLAHFTGEGHVPAADTLSLAPLIQSVGVGRETWPAKGPFDLRHWQNNLTIQYASLDFVQRGKIEYRYRLNPSGQWTYTKSRRIEFPALAPGNYRFEVQASLASGWSQSRALEFSIDRPFWQKSRFQVLIGLCLTGILAWTWRWSIERIRRKNERERRLLHLERSALQAQMNPHFIFNALNSIQGFIQTGDKKNASRYLSKFARLIRSILEQSRMEKVTLGAELAALREYLDLERMRMGNRFDYYIEVNSGADLYEIAFPPMLIQPFLENAVKHGIGPKTSEGRIDLILHAEPPLLHVTVRDNGVGIQYSLENKEPGHAPGKSVGMQIIRERLALNNGEKGRDCVDARELKAPDGTVLGTEVRFCIRYES